MENLRQPAEIACAQELEALRAQDKDARPLHWQLSPKSVVMFLIGGKLPDGTDISTKYFGSRRLMEVAVATLATDRALLLLGVPGTAKTWVAEHIAAAISGNSMRLVQGTAGTQEDAIRYGWNYARLLAEGPVREALVESPIMQAMREGSIARIEELTRIPSDVQDGLITLLSEKVLPIPELNSEVFARRGFNIIATANHLDKGVNELSGALRRRFNMVVLPLPATLEEEVQIVQTRVAQMGAAFDLPPDIAPVAEIQRLVTIFRELRSGVTADGKQKLKSPTATLSTAEAISVMNSGASLAQHFGDGKVSARDLASGIIGAVIKDPTRDTVVWKEYVETVVKGRKPWADLYEAFSEG